MEAKFTKGKWLIGVNNTIVDDSAAENEIATIEIWDQCPWVSKANAHLIAAAPDLYAEIELEIKELEFRLENSALNECERWDIPESIKRKKSLIAKAKGE